MAIVFSFVLNSNTVVHRFSKNWSPQNVLLNGNFQLNRNFWVSLLSFFGVLTTGPAIPNLTRFGVGVWAATSQTRSLSFLHIHLLILTVVGHDQKSKANESKVFIPGLGKGGTNRRRDSGRGPSNDTKAGMQLMIYLHGGHFNSGSSLPKYNTIPFESILAAF